MENIRDLILMSEVVAKEKNIPTESVITYLSEGIETAFKRDLPEGSLVQADIDVENKEINVWRLFQLVNQIENPEAEMLFSEIEDEIVEDGYVWEPIEFKLTRQQLNIVRQAAFKKINDKAKTTHIEDLLSKQFKIYTGTLKIAKKDSYLIDLMGFDILLPKKFAVAKDSIKLGSKVTFTIEFDSDKKQYFATQTSPQFLIELFKKEIVQVEEGDIEIVNCVRAPGFKSKVIVKAKNNKYDPVKTCIGHKGAHIKNIQMFLNDESIDVVLYQKDPVHFLLNLISPINISKVLLDEDKKIVEFSVNDADISKAIGRGGKNIELVARALNWKVFIYSDSQWDAKESIQNKAYRQTLMEALDCSEELADYLIAEEYTSVEQIAYAPESELVLPELDDETIVALQNNAKAAVTDKELMTKLQNEESLHLLGFNDEQIEKLHTNKVYNKSDVADLSSYELNDIFPEIDIDKAGDIIMEARNK